MSSGEEIRQRGTVVSLHKSASQYGGGFGEIVSDAGECYVFSTSNWFRNFSHPAIGAIVTFEVVAYSYASSIDRVDKHAPTARGED